jgi:hypothetical protein
MQRSQLRNTTSKAKFDSETTLMLELNDPIRSSTEARLAALLQDLNKATDQLNSANDEVARNRFKRQIELLENEYEEESGKRMSTARSLRQLDSEWKDRLPEIDYRKARKIAGHVHEKRFEQNFGAASFLIQNSDEMEGDLCVELLRQKFKINWSTLRHHRLEFHDETQINAAALVAGLKRWLGLDRSAENLDREIEMINREICGQLRNSSVIFVELYFGESLAHCREFLHWALTAFWRPLVAEARNAALNYFPIHTILVVRSAGVVYQRRQSPAFLCSEKQFDPHKLLDLPLQGWTEQEIGMWLRKCEGLDLDNEAIGRMAQRIYGSKRTPNKTRRSALEGELYKHFDRRS